MSPTPGRSTLMQSAPIYARSWVQVGPDCTCVKSRILMPSSALPAWPKGFVDGFGRPLPLPTPLAIVAFTLATALLSELFFVCFFAAECFAAAFFAATLRAGAFALVLFAGLAAFFCFLAISFLQKFECVIISSSPRFAG